PLHPVEHAGGDAGVDGQRHQGLAALLAPANLHLCDVHAALPQQRADPPDDPGPVLVEQERHVLGRGHVDGDAVDGHQALGVARAHGGAGHPDRPPRPLAGQGDQGHPVAAWAGLGLGDLDAALGRQQGRVHEGHRLVGDRAEDPLEGGQGQHPGVLLDQGGHVGGLQPPAAPPRSSSRGPPPGAWPPPPGPPPARATYSWPSFSTRGRNGRRASGTGPASTLTALGTNWPARARRSSPATTSRAAPASWPSPTALARAASSTIPPRAVLTSRAPRFMAASSASPISPVVSGALGRWTVTTSARPSTSARLASSTPIWAARSRLTNGSPARRARP